jgi:TPR repeat protein
MHFRGEGGPVDFAEARRLYGLAVAQGHADAQNNLGWMHEIGEGGPEDLAEARRLYGLAAAQGNADAQNSLGWMRAAQPGGGGAPPRRAEGGDRPRVHIK